jgi:hypothetical protein
MKPPEKTTYKEKTTKVYQTVRTVSKFNGGKTEVETEVKWISLTHMHQILQLLTVFFFLLHIEQLFPA